MYLLYFVEVGCFTYFFSLFPPPFCLPSPILSLFSPCSLKREIRKLAQDECGYEEPTVAMAFVYFEKLVLQGKLNKQNRKLCAGACVLLAAKIGGDLKKHEVKLLIDVSKT